MRDRIASLEQAQAPALRPRADTKNLVILVEDELRQAALALGRMEGYLGRALAVLEKDAVAAAAVEAVAMDPGPFEDLDGLAENLSNLRRHMGRIAVSLAKRE